MLREFRLIAIASVFTGVAILNIGCAPVQSGSDQVPDINININELRDAVYVANMPAQVDLLMFQFIDATGVFEGGAQIPGCAVGIMEQNNVTRLKGYGLADIPNNVQFTHRTPSVVGSVSKTWTALAALWLVEMGLLSLEDPVAKHVAGVPAAWQNKTVRQLLSHTSGLAYMPTFAAALSHEVMLSQYWFGPGIVIPQLGIHPRLVLPSYTPTPVESFGSWTARYSNTGYMLLGAIIDRIVSTNSGIVGESYDAYESFVWRQVGVHGGNINTQMFSQSLNEYWRQTDIPHLAKGYTLDANSGLFHQTLFFNSPLLLSGPAGWEGPAGGWTMTIGDLVRLMSAIQNNRIITQQMKNSQMMKVYGSDNSGNWGLGVNLITKLGKSVYMHDGAYPGYRARYTVWPNESFGVALMCNGSDANLNRATDEIAKLFIGASGTGGIAPDPASGVSPRVQHAAEMLETSGDDPGLAARVSQNAPLQIPASERYITTEQVLRQRTRHLATAGARELRSSEADLLQCGRLLRSLAAPGSPFAKCAESPRTSDEAVSCAVAMARDLYQRGGIDRQTYEQVSSCAAVATRAK